jgi:heptosyltransferase-2/heptosyltransferase-3
MTDSSANPAPVTLVRAGALGDFLLTLPLVKAWRSAGRQVRIVSRAGYRPLLPTDWGAMFVSVDHPAAAALFAPSAGPDRARDDGLVAGAEIHLFAGPDPDTDRGLLERGAVAVCRHPPRPTAPPHFTVQALERAGLEYGPDLLTTPRLRALPAPAADSLWIHPGSGSRSKNTAIAWFREAATLMLDHAPARVRHILVSFGEADSEVRAAWTAEHGTIAGITPEPVTDLSLESLAGAVAERAVLYLGNDSGVSHLAAALGIPSLCSFLTTAPGIWHPLGPVQPLSPPGSPLAAETGVLPPALLARLAAIEHLRA